MKIDSRELEALLVRARKPKLSLGGRSVGVVEAFVLAGIAGYFAYGLLAVLF